MLPVRCAICDAKCSEGGVLACQRCKSTRSVIGAVGRRGHGVGWLRRAASQVPDQDFCRFCSKACEEAAGERGHSERCAVICRLPAVSEQQKKLVRFFACATSG